MINSSKMLILGLPSAGKTTFIAALWHVVSSGEVAEALVLDKLQPDRSHLNGIAKLWRECKELPRTTLDRERTITLNLRDPKSGSTHTISLPDASGEGFRRIFESRKWSPEFAQLVSDADSLLFFIHPSSLTGVYRIDEDIEHMARTVNPKLQCDPEQSGGNIKPWEPNLAAQQAKFVDLIQLIQSARDMRGLRMGIIISAWDMIKPQNLQPHEWLRKQTPLLFQYLESHRVEFPYQIFGVSAQGDELIHAETLREIVQPSERTEVVFEGKSSHDITSPIRWILQ